MTDLLVRDSSDEHDRGGEHAPTTRTLVFDLEAPWLLHALFRSDAYQSHVRSRITPRIALATNEGYAVGTVVATDGVPPEERSFDDYFSGGESQPHDKAAVTFRDDIHDVDAVLPAVEEALKAVRPIRDAVEGRDSE